jgi:hypothetical protein
METSKPSLDVKQIIATQLSVPVICILQFFVPHSNQDCIMPFYQIYGKEAVTTQGEWSQIIES